MASKMSKIAGAIPIKPLNATFIAFLKGILSIILVPIEIIMNTIAINGKDNPEIDSNKNSREYKTEHYYYHN